MGPDGQGKPTVSVVETEEIKAPTLRVPAGTLKRVLPKNPRNKPCGCQSGKKYKHCCLENATPENTYYLAEKKNA
jgi:hypothetical protein